MYRTKVNNLSLAQVRSLTAGLTPAAARGDSEDLSGRSFRLVLDDGPVKAPELSYSFPDGDTLLCSENGGEPQRCRYTAMSLRDVILFSHAVPGQMKAYAVILDQKRGVVTVYDMWFIDYEGRDLTDSGISVFECADLDPFINREVQRQVYHGFLSGRGRRRRRSGTA